MIKEMSYLEARLVEFSSCRKSSIWGQSLSVAQVPRGAEKGCFSSVIVLKSGAPLG